MAKIKKAKFVPFLNKKFAERNAMLEETANYQGTIPTPKVKAKGKIKK